MCQEAEALQGASPHSWGGGARWPLPLFVEGQRFKILGYYDSEGSTRGGGRAIFGCYARLAEVDARRLTRPGDHHGGIIVEEMAFSVLFMAAQDGGGQMTLMLLMFGPLILFFWLLMLRPQQQERKRRQAMLAALKKNDRVITIGGIYGVVTNVHREGEEEAIKDVTIKVDESSNVKLRVTIGSIARVLVDRESGDDSSK